MLVSVKTYVTFFEVRRGHLIVEAMTVREEERAGGDYFMIILESEIGNHLVDFAVAISFDDYEFARIVANVAVQKRRHFHRRIAFRQRVSRAVVVYVAEQNKRRAVCYFDDSFCADCASV